MNVEGPGTKTPAELIMELQNGARLVVFHYCVSLLVVTFKRSSDVYLVKPGESALRKGMGYTLLSLLLGWWGIPWGLIYTLESIVINLQGGRDVTQEVVAALLPAASAQEKAELERLVPQAADGRPGVTMDEFSKAVSAGEPFPAERPEPGARRRQILGLAALAAVGLGVVALAIVGLAQWSQRTDSLQAGVWGLPAQATATWEARLAKPAPTVAPGYVSYTNEDHGFCVHHPEGWLVDVRDMRDPETGEVTSRLVSFSAPTEGPEGMLDIWVQSITVTNALPQPTPTDQQYLELIGNVFIEEQEREPLEETSLMDVDGCRAAQVVYSFTDPYVAEPMVGHGTIFYVEDRTFFFIEGVAISENHEELRSVYDRFLASFRVLPVP